MILDFRVKDVFPKRSRTDTLFAMNNAGKELCGAESHTFSTNIPTSICPSATCTGNKSPMLPAGVGMPPSASIILGGNISMIFPSAQPWLRHSHRQCSQTPSPCHSACRRFPLTHRLLSECPEQCHTRYPGKLRVGNVPLLIRTSSFQPQYHCRGGPAPPRTALA